MRRPLRIDFGLFRNGKPLISFCNLQAPFSLAALAFVLCLRRVRRRQAAAAHEQAVALADKRRRQDEAAMVDRQQLVNHYKHSVLGDKSSYGRL